MLFFLKKYIGSLLMPLPLLLIIGFIGLILLWFTRWQRCGKTFTSLSLILLAVLGLQPVSDSLLAPVEGQYNKRYELITETPPQNIQYIVVLGGGFTYNPDWSPSSNLLNNSLPRVTEGVRLYLKHPDSKLIFTGGKASSTISSAEVAAQVAQSLGVPAQDTIPLTEPKDTQEEAFEVEKIIGKSPFLLVTSANHLPRAITMFTDRGMQPFPAPANQLVITSGINPWEKYIPSAYYFSHSERAWYEFLGTIWWHLKPDNTQSIDSSLPTPEATVAE
ncbi:envelope biogenesis factor ElyC [Providencia rettgeri]|uniref:envelope biogenesis factor ElyC n=1 Tax=Providencia TaxID=586 RepID=UPI001C832759|nr:envelope biogenesis factor ElyC [Providencia rettgeri]MBX6968796.1 envelope biogenesis factor ElyC [Providencia rettgeri]MBX6977462.1 envelope biogenesis factor ElyC [Providencia rettgeri]MBX6994530.1 envelope biogenesis factor ElyC [Providencia rettgeri]MBX6998871.1 envelope biogenesis factor ElyC [Providencia rettgeri]MBX7017240.1 envelope biogenesis factor ElyC [Providencia rettgeri]